jgi:O-antigen/teichoic acid export membrane protein
MFLEFRQRVAARLGVGRDFVSGFAWNHAAKVAEYLLLYLLSVAIARSLGPSANGEYATLMTLCQLLLTFGSAAFDLALNRFLPQFSNSPGKTSYIVRRMLATKIVIIAAVSILLFLRWSDVRQWFDFQSPSTLYVVFVVVVGFLRAISSTLAAVAVSRLESKVIFVINAGSLFLQLAAVEMLVSHQSGLTPVLFIVLAGSLASSSAYLFAERRSLLTPVEPSAMKPVASFAGWLWVNAFTTFIYGRQGDIMMLSLFAVSKGSIGMYDVASSLSMLPAFAAAAGLGGISVSMFSRISSSGRDKVSEFWSRLSALLTNFTVPLYCFLGVYASEVVGMLYSEQYADGATLLQVFVAARLIARLFGGGESFDALLSTNGERPAVGIGLVGSLMNLALNIILIPKFQALGAVVSTSSMIVVVDAATWLLLKKRVGAPLLIKNWLTSCSVGLLPVVFMKMLIPHPNPPQLLLCAAPCIFVWVFWIMNFQLRPGRSAETTDAAA